MSLQVKDTKTRKKTDKLENFQNEPVGIGGRPLISIWINPTPLGRNGLHCIDFPHHMRKVLLNLAPSEPLALVQELPLFDNSIKLDPLLVSALDKFFHNMIIGCMHSDLRSIGFICSSISEVSNNGGKYGRRISTLNIGCKPRKGGMLRSKTLSPTDLVLVYNP
jgi:hypothetical protein